jgi:hypothetical protein
VPADGLRRAFELAAAGKTDREVAQALSAAGYRTTGNRGANPFTKDTVREVLQNRFYQGELPDGNGGWLPGRHQALVDRDLFEAAQRARVANTKKPRRVPGIRSPWALSGVATCAECGQSIIVHGRPDGRSRLRCAGRAQGNGCGQPSFFADEAEGQIGELLGRFAVPASHRSRLLAAWRRRQSADVDVAAERLRLGRQQERLKRLFLMGDLDEAEYRAGKANVAERLAALPPTGNPDDAAGERLAGFLANVQAAWEAAAPDERNRLARQVFGRVVVENKTVVAVVPRPGLAPFFDLVAVKGITAEATGVGSARSEPCGLSCARPRPRRWPGVAPVSDLRLAA